jgi:hypothetical protein
VESTQQNCKRKKTVKDHRLRVLHLHLSKLCIYFIGVSLSDHWSICGAVVVGQSYQ